MLRVVVGRFREEQAADRALSEFGQKHPEIDPLVSRRVKAKHRLLSGVAPKGQRTELIAAAAGILGIIIGIPLMIVLGQLGKAAIQLPMLMGLSLVAMAIFTWDTIRGLALPRFRHELPEEREYTEVVVNTSDPDGVEDIFSRAGAEEIALRRAA